MAMSTQTLLVNGGPVAFNFSPDDADGLAGFGYDAAGIRGALDNFVCAALDRAVVKYIIKSALIGGSMSAGDAEIRANLILNEPNGAYQAAQTIIEYHLGVRT